MTKSMSHQKDAVTSGYWPLYRYDPSEVDDGQPFKLDRPAFDPVSDFVANEGRYAILERTHPDRAPGSRQALCRPTSTSGGGTTSSSLSMQRTIPHAHPSDPADQEASP